MSDFDKLILTDCDGVLLNWNWGFKNWMEARGHSMVNKDEYDASLQYDVPKEHARDYVRYFNESAACGYLPPFRDAVKYVKKLHEQHGFVFHVISSMSSDPYAQRSRIQNLERIFGKSVFEGFTILDCGQDKKSALKKYKSSHLWLEDVPKNAVDGEKLGHESVLFVHDHNLEWVRRTEQYEFSPVSRMSKVNSWKELYELKFGGFNV